MIEFKKIDLSSAIESLKAMKHEMPKRFYLPYDIDEVRQLLEAYYRNEVLSRTTMFETKDNVVYTNTMKVAEWLVSPKKRVGLMMMGEVGTGKTTMLKAVCDTINLLCESAQENDGRYCPTLSGMYSKPISIVKAKQIVETKNNDEQRYKMMNKVDLLAIDELGVESVESKSYGNVSEPLIDLLSERYDRQLCTIITTNLNLASIGERYGDRVLDMFNEMFRIISFKNESYRK